MKAQNYAAAEAEPERTRELTFPNNPVLSGQPLHLLLQGLQGVYSGTQQLLLLAWGLTQSMVHIT